MITITLSTFLILYSNLLYERLQPVLRLFERRNPFREVALETTQEPARGFNVIVFAMGRFGSSLADGLTKSGKRVLGVEFDSDLLQRFRDSGSDVVYGDAEDPEFASSLPLSHVRWVISSVPHVSINLALINTLSHYGFIGNIATTAHNERDAKKLKDGGSRLVLLPFRDAAKEAVGEIVSLFPDSK